MFGKIKNTIVKENIQICHIFKKIFKIYTVFPLKHVYFIALIYVYEINH